MSFVNVKCGSTLLEVPKDSTFMDIIHLLNDPKIVGFSCATTQKIISPLDLVIEDLSVVKIYDQHLIGNLLNALSSVLEVPVVAIEMEEEGGFAKKCVVKFETEQTFSEAAFDEYIKSVKDLINKKAQKMVSEEPLHSFLCENHLNLLPFDFSFEKIAQEEFDGKKIQKFTIIVFKDPQEREKYYEHANLLKTIDHRYIGKNLEYFMMIPEAPGCAFWLPKGWKLFRKLEAFVRKNAYVGFNEVKTPFVMSNAFWKKSGHLVSFKQNMMFVNMGGCASEDSALKPMNCPAHIEIFQRKIRSHKDLPLRIAEFGSCHRYEPSGSLHGLMRVRSLTQDDGHIFCALEHIEAETKNFLNNCISMYKKLGFDSFNVILATKPENALGDAQEWELAETYLANSLKAVGLDFTVAEGEGAFYGPKIELHVKDSIGRSWQLGTIQLDFVLPQRFNLSYTASDGSEGKVCMLHRAILGSLERFIGVLLEHHKGHLPVFLAPVQIVVCSVIAECNEYAKTVSDLLSASGIDTELDIRNETLSYKVRAHRIAKIPGIVIIGKKEQAEKTMTLEYLGEKMLFKLDEVTKVVRLFNEN